MAQKLKAVDLGSWSLKVVTLNRTLVGTGVAGVEERPMASRGDGKGREREAWKLLREVFGEKKLAGEAVTVGYPGERVLIVDDILTTGSSVHEVIAAVNKLDGNIVGIGVMVDRSGQAPDFGFPLFSCHRAATVTYRPEECPLCAAGVPLVKPGSSQQPA